MAFKRFVTELLRRKVVRVAIGYALVAWLLLQVAELTFEPLRLPEWALTFVIVLAAIGFAVALVLAWAFEVTPEGLRRDPVDVDVRSVAGGAEAMTADAGPPQEPPDRAYPSVAVLPFLDMSPEKELGSFCEGVAEEILNGLSRIPCLRVQARTSSPRLKNGSSDARAIGRELGVRYAVEGSVRTAGDRLRITAELVDVQNGYHRWADSFEAVVENGLDAEVQIAKRVVEALCATIAPDELDIPSRSRTRDLDAYDYYRQGRRYFNRFTHRHVEFAQQLFARSVELDPELAVGWAGLAECHAYLYMFARASDEHRVGASEASQTALKLGPALPRCHTVRGLAHMISGEHAEAATEFEAALRLDPGQFEATYYYARNCVHQGDMEKAAELFEAAAAARPWDYQAPLLLLPIYRSMNRRADLLDSARRGVAAAAAQLELRPDDVRALYLGCTGLLVLDETAKADEWARRAVELAPDDGLVLYNIACFYTQAGEIAHALDCLERAALPGMASRSWIEHDDDLAPLRGNPRFEAIVATL